MDEAIGLPTESAARLALRTQQVIAHESGVPRHADPFGGSYVVEELTDRIESEVLAYLRVIEEMGGALTAIETGWMQAQIHESAYRYQKQVESGEQIVVGVNRFLSDDAAPIPVFRPNEESERRQIENVRAVRASRAEEATRSRLRNLSAAARGQENLMPHILEAACSLATVGEIAAALRDVFGQHRDTG
jgi:methylmalonyl-CoA mutase N-terminal domain/subunit